MTEAVRGTIEDSRPAVIDAVEHTSQSISTSAQSIANSVQGVAADARPAVVDALKSTSQSVKSAASTVSETVKSTATEAKPAVVDALQSTSESVKSAATSASETVKSTVADAKPAVVDAVQKTSEQVKDSATAMGSSVQQSLQSTMQSAPREYSSIEDQYQEALELGRQGKLEQAAVLFQQVAYQVPDSPEVHYNLGVVLGKTGDREGGITHIREARNLCQQQGYLRDAENLDQILSMLNA
jgi:Flp pilus assembly protein TadD